MDEFDYEDFPGYYDGDGNGDGDSHGGPGSQAMDLGGPCEADDPSAVDETDDLTVVEMDIARILQLCEDTCAELARGNERNMELVEELVREFYSTLTKIHKDLRRHFQKRKHALPFKRTCYAERKAADIAQQKLALAAALVARVVDACDANSDVALASAAGAAGAFSGGRAMSEGRDDISASS